MAYIPVYARRKAGLEPVSYPDERLREILHDTYGICLAGDSLVFDAGSGRRIRIDQLADYDDVLVQGMERRVRSSPCTHYQVDGQWRQAGLRNAAQERYEDQGHGQSRVPHRRWLEAVGAPCSRRLCRDTSVVVASSVKDAGSRRSEQARVKVLAYLLSDGSLTQPDPTFYSSDPRLLADFEGACSLAFKDLSFSRYTGPRDVVRVAVVKDPAWNAAYHARSPVSTHGCVH